MENPIVFYFGFPYNDLVSVTSFLALAIGVDDTFIMLEAWKRFGRTASTTRERLEATLAEAGSSITFTSFTDVMAFGIGASMKVPALQHFCIFTATAIFFDFIYQVTFFPAAMIFAEDLRPLCKIAMSKLRRTGSLSSTSSSFEKVVPFSPEKPPLTMFVLKIPSPEDLPKRRKRRKSGAPEILHRFVSGHIAQTICIGLVILGMFLCLGGTSRLEPSASFSKLLVDDSKTHAYVEHYDKFFWSEALLYHVIVKSPDFRNASDVYHFMEFVNKLESIDKYSVGRDSTTLWLTKFFDYLQLFGIGYENLAIELDQYLKKAPDPDVKTAGQRLSGPNSQVVNLPSEFYFSTGMWGIDNWPERAEFLKNLSKIKEAYPEFQPSFFSEPIFLTDLLIYSESGMSRTLGIVLICTFCITLLFLPWDRPLLVFWVSTSFLTINGCVIGVLSWWFVDIDIISMVTLLMSVGFSVDYTVHLAYQFSRSLRDSVGSFENSSNSDLSMKSSSSGSSDSDSQKEVSAAILETFQAVLRPILLSGISTLVAVFLVIFVKSYMIRVFLKTVFAVVILGLAQSLVILPMVFLLTSRLVPLRYSRTQMK